MHRLSFAALCIIAASTYGARADYVTKVMQADAELQLLRDGFDQPAVDAIKTAAFASNLYRVCGEDYLSKDVALFAVKSGAEKHSVPIKIFGSKVLDFADIEYRNLNKDTKLALAFCREAKSYFDSNREKTNNVKRK